MNSDVLDLEDEFEMETFRTLVNILNDDFKSLLNSVEAKLKATKSVKSESNCDTIQILDFFLKKLKHNNQNEKENTCYEWDSNSCESIVNAFNVIFKVIMKTMRLSEYFSKKLNSSNHPYQVYSLKDTSLKTSQVSVCQPSIDAKGLENDFHFANNNVSTDEDVGQEDDPIRPFSMQSTDKIFSYQNDISQSNYSSSINQQQQQQQSSKIVSPGFKNFVTSSTSSSIINSSNQSLYSLNNVDGLFSYTRAPVTNRETSKLKKKVFRRIYYCQICPFSHYGLTYLNQHILKHNYLPGVPKCLYCEFYETSKIKMDNHLKLHLNKQSFKQESSS